MNWWSLFIVDCHSFLLAFDPFSLYKYTQIKKNVENIFYYTIIKRNEYKYPFKCFLFIILFGILEIWINQNQVQKYFNYSKIFYKRPSWYSQKALWTNQKGLLEVPRRPWLFSARGAKKALKIKALMSKAFFKALCQKA